MKTINVAIAGLGSIGSSVAQALDKGIPGLELAAVGVRDKNKADRLLRGLSRPPHVTTIDLLEPHADVVVECVPAQHLSDVTEPFLSKGKKAIVLSCGALLERMHLVDLARRHGGQIIVPSGALLGLDAVCAAAQGTISSARMVTRKPPGGLAGAPYLVERNIDLRRVTEPLLVFSGAVRDVARGFPANLNVAVALALAGIGPDRTTIDIWADPGIYRNIHRIEVESDSARLQMSIENIPSENPRTGRITAQSVIATLRRMTAALAIG